MATESIIKFSEDKIEALTVEEIHGMLIRKISDIYNVNVDPSGWTADAIYQKVLAQYFSDFAQVAKESYDMLNVDIATGKRLDNLVGVLGVKRKGNSAAKITASINYFSDTFFTVDSLTIGTAIVEIREPKVYVYTLNGWVAEDLALSEETLTSDINYKFIGEKLYNRNGDSWVQIASSKVKVKRKDEITIENNQVLGFLDISGNVWYLIDPSRPLEQNPLQGKINLLDGVTLVSQKFGEITNDSIGSQFVSAWITTYDNEDYSTRYLNYAGFTISNLEFLNRGSKYEDDDTLRVRFKSMNITGLSSNTLEDSLKANLIASFKKIEDVYILSNPEDNLIINKSEFKDGETETVTLTKHNVLPIIKIQNQGTLDGFESDKVLEVVRKKLPLGIATQKIDEWGFGVNVKTSIKQPVPSSPSITRTYSLLIANSVSPTIRIKLSANFENSVFENEIHARIREMLYDYSKSFKIGEPIVLDDLRNRIYLTNDNLLNPAYRVDDISINGVKSNYQTGFKYWKVNSESHIEFVTDPDEV